MAEEQNAENKPHAQNHKLPEDQQPIFCVSFFDVADPGSAVSLENGTKIEFRAHDTSYSGQVYRGSAGSQQVTLTKEDGKTQQLIRLLAEKKLSAEIESQEYRMGCARYTSSRVHFFLSAKSKECCPVPVVLNQQVEGCRIHFGASVKGAGDDPVKLEKNVTWTVQEIVTPLTSSASKGHRRGTTARPFEASVTAVDGVAEMFDVPFERLYQIEVHAPDGYVCHESTQLRHICCDEILEIPTHFQVCGAKPHRSVLFVQAGCPSMRWYPGEDAKVSVAGIPREVNEKGLMDLPHDTKEGVFPLSFPGKVFTPASIALTREGPPVITVTVADQPALRSGRLVPGQLAGAGTTTSSTVRGQLVDGETKRPFAKRTVVVKLPNGEETKQLTDGEGYFHVPSGATVHAEDDDFGFETEHIVMTESE